MRDGQDAGELLLDIEARIGELLPSAEDARKTAFTGKERQKRPEWIDGKKAHQARTIKAHPDIVARDFLQKEMDKAKDWDSSSKFIRAIFQTEPAFRASKGVGIGSPTILKFLGGSWKAWEVQLWTTVDRSKRASHSGSPVNGGPCED